MQNEEKVRIALGLIKKAKNTKENKRKGASHRNLYSCHIFIIVQILFSYFYLYVSMMVLFYSNCFTKYNKNKKSYKNYKQVSISLGLITDRLKHKMKAIIITLLIISTASFIWLTLMCLPGSQANILNFAKPFQFSTSIH